MHHSVSDGWSLGVFFRELVSLYQRVSRTASARRSRRCRSSTPTTRSGSGAGCRAQVLEEQLAYWREQLKELPPLLTLPTDRPRPAEQTFARQHGALRAAGGADGEAAGVEPRAGRDVVHDAAGGVRGAARPVRGSAGRGGGHADREPHAARDRRADRVLRQHAGDAPGLERRSALRGRC